MISFLPDFITEDAYRNGYIKHLPIANCDVSVWTQLLIHKNKWRSPALNAFIDFTERLSVNKTSDILHNTAPYHYYRDRRAVV